MTMYTKLSTDAGMVAIQNTAGALITILDTLLVTTMGWTKEYIGTNLAVYKQPAGSNGMYLYVDDTNIAYAKVMGYRTMTSISEGVGRFPSANLGTTVYVDKAASSPWRFISNGKLFFLFFGASSIPFIFGDFFSVVPSDVTNTLLIGQDINGSATSYGVVTSNSSNLSAHYLAANFTQLTTSPYFSKGSINGAAINGLIQYPNPADGGIYMVPLTIFENSGVVIRGQLPGMWAPMHAYTALSTGDTFQGAGAQAGKTFVAVRSGSSATVFMEISDTWSFN